MLKVLVGALARVLFSKARAVEGAEPSSRSTEREIPFSALSLSGGMRQNAYIAMALAQDTEYILLDEPTTYLDITHRLALMKILRALADNGKGIVSVMHDLPIALSFSDKIAVMDQGKILISDTPHKISEAGILERLFGVLIGKSDKNDYFYRYSEG